MRRRVVVAFGTGKVVAGGGLPESCIKVLRVLNSRKDKGVSQSHIVSETGLSVRSVKYAVQRLIAEKILAERFLLDDLRKKIYILEGKGNAA